MSKCLLHKNHLQEFKAWLDSKGVRHREGRGRYQALQVCKDGKHWNCVYVRDLMPEHFSTDRHLDSLVSSFCRERKQSKADTGGRHG